MLTVKSVVEKTAFATSNEVVSAKLMANLMSIFLINWIHQSSIMRLKLSTTKDFFENFLKNKNKLFFFHILNFFILFINKK